MKKEEKITPSVVSGKELYDAIKAGDRKTMCAHLGIFIGAKDGAADTMKKAAYYLSLIEIRKQNWEALIEYLNPTVKEELEKEADKLVELIQKRNLTPEQIAYTIEQLKSA